jgi:voltage-gated potassium channel
MGQFQRYPAQVEALNRSSWRRTLTSWRHLLGRRVALDRWYPHVPIALAAAPIGLLMIAGSARRGLGVGPSSFEIEELERGANALHLSAIVEAALGVSLLVIALGLAMRSRLAWLWAVIVTGSGVCIRMLASSDRSFAAYYAILLVALLVYRRHFRSLNLASSSVFAVTAIATFLMWATLGTLRLGAHFQPPIRDLPSAVYFAVVTFSSVGYGDIVPADRDARLFVSVMIGVGLLVGATAFGTILLPLVGGRLRQILGGRQEMDRSNHYVVVGQSLLARNTTTELESRGERVTLILDSAPAEDFYKERDVVVGDATDLSVLRTAGVENAKGVLALSADDPENGFVVLGVNELNPTIRTVAALNDAKNEFRLKRTQPSLILSLQSLGGELLAMALTGERVDVQMLSRVLQVQGAEPKGSPKE